MSPESNIILAQAFNLTEAPQGMGMITNMKSITKNLVLFSNS